MSIELLTSVLLELGIVSNFVNVVSDTFTLIVGFVAIGIPLSIQIASGVTEKYDSSLLAERLTKGSFVQPTSIIVASIIYIFLSLYLKTTVKDSSSHLSQELVTNLVTLLLFIFFWTVTAAAWFYIRLYRRTLVTTEVYIRDFLMLNNSLFVRAIIKLVVLSKQGAYFTKLKRKNDGSYFYYSKISSNKLGYVSAGLEVLIEQLKNKSWESNFVEILFSFHKRIVKTYFDAQSPQVRLSEIDVKFIKLYWDALVRITRVSREAEDAKLSFHSQRLLAQMISHIVHHPQYNTLVAESYSLTSDNRINWSSDLYEIARWQGLQSGKGIDLVLECEWFRDVFGIFNHVNMRGELNGVLTATRTVVDIFNIVAQDHPYKILTVYKNISENLNGHLHSNYIFYQPTDKRKRWILKFWRDFNNTEYTIDKLSDFEDKIRSLSNGGAYLKYGEFSVSTPLNDEDIGLSLKAIDSESLYDDIFLRYMKRIGWEMAARFAFYQRWQEFYDCLEWKQPRESSACYLGQSLFASSATELLDLIFRDFDYIEEHHRFHDRYEISAFVFRAVLYQLCYFSSRGNVVGLVYNDGTYEDGEKQKSILLNLIKQREHVKFVGFDEKVLTSVMDDINSSIKGIDERVLRDILGKPIDLGNWVILKDSLVKGWQENSELLGILNVRYVTEILNNDTCILTRSIKRKYLIDSNGQKEDFYHCGRFLVDNLFQKLYSCLYDVAKTGSLTDIIIDCVVVFSSKKTLGNLGFKIGERNIWVHEKCSKSFGYLADDEKTLVIDNKNVAINLSLNPLWSEFSSAVFSYFIDTNEDEVELKVEVFYEIALKNDSGVLVI
ncbi:hypothetical protein Q4Q57_13075 [Shewanella sp. SP2S2-6]|uniref:hypothetical protein n=1 Tax=Shewanella sp. SP2S2-6 TaxID=3063540 RepID=UPI00288D7CDA|nr:hypothetical protein [Shewanella sp. SP2S2-6]MDT3296073.1 hypothetical protein [Shewanella sp. SP2S2-6]